MFLRNDNEYGFSGGAAAISFGRATAIPTKPSFADRLRERYPDFEIAPDLGSQIFSPTWFRGVATCVGLCTMAWMMAPSFGQPIYGLVPAPMQGADLDESRALSIAPLAMGANSGRHMAANDLVGPLSETPERPVIKNSFALVSGGGFTGALQRSGVGKDDAIKVADLVGRQVPLDELKSGYEAEVTLGRRTSKSQPRPLERLAFRAKFDASIEVFRTAAGALQVKKIPITIDNTPLRIEAEVGGSVYRTARALGAPANAVAEYLKTIATRVPISRLGSGARIDLVVQRARAATGEVQFGPLLLAGVQQGRNSLTLMKWEKGGKAQWLDSTGAGERQGMMNMPVTGARISSTFGLRFHPILHTERMHKGLDLAAPYGSPIHAAMDGVVAMAGRAGGYGNFVKLAHADCLATGYGHMSRILVRPGQHVHRGDLIGMVGSTGLSTGPHLHYEVTKCGVAINPGKVTYSTVERLAGADLREFKARLSQLLATPAGGDRGK